VFCISYRRQFSDQGVTNPVYVGNVASQFVSPIYEEIKAVYSGQPDAIPTADDDYDDVDRISIKSDNIPVNEETCKNSEPLPPPRQKKVTTTDSEAPMQLVAASEYTSLKNCTTNKSLAPSDQAVTTTHEPEAPTTGDDGNNYAALITPPTASTGVYQELVVAPPVPPGYDVPSNIPATSPATNTLEDNNTS